MNRVIELISVLVLLLQTHTATAASLSDVANAVDDSGRWSLYWVEPGESDARIAQIPVTLSEPQTLQTQIRNLDFLITLLPDSAFIVIKAQVSSERISRIGYFSLRFCQSGAALFNYDGLVDSTEIFRQSPHNPMNYFPDMAGQAVPMVAIQTDSGFAAAVSNAPLFFDNFCTQAFYPGRGQVHLNSGDNGLQPGKQALKAVVKPHYFCVTPYAPHRFDALTLQLPTLELSRLRLAVLSAVAAHWGGIKDRYGAIAFASNYLHLRSDELGFSRAVVVPGIHYSNYQYSRDAFWQSMILPPELAAECYRHVGMRRELRAEIPLLFLIWSWRSVKSGMEIDSDLLQPYLEYIESHTVDGAYRAANDSINKNMQSWFDLCAFADDDVITYNQGLLACSLLAAEKLGLASGLSADQAIAVYQGLFLPEAGYFPLSRKKNAVTVDALVGDLLAQVLFGYPLLSTAAVEQHFNTLMRVSHTPFGFKCVCDPQGGYLPADFYDLPTFKAWLPDFEYGYYCYGGSYFLYDLLASIDAYLHGVPGAEKEIIRRTQIDFSAGGTYYEHLHTVTGKPGKANQGWNAAIYALWRELLVQGKTDSDYFQRIDALLRF
ncbi:MAG TPA: hypothetical protein PKN04_10935 [bacterium]|nr:hypothetical protein [bacterium]